MIPEDFRFFLVEEKKPPASSAWGMIGNVVII